MPRANGGPTAAHPPTAAAAAQHQKKPPQTHHSPKKNTENITTANGTSRVTLTRFKPGFEWDTECELAQAFRRPP